MQHQIELPIGPLPPPKPMTVATLTKCHIGHIAAISGGAEMMPHPDQDRPAHELYSQYVGLITPAKFMEDYPGLSYREAIRDYWEDCPDWLLGKLVRHFEEQLEEAEHE